MDQPSPDAARDARPLCVDLDGTLVATDTLWESFMLLVRRAPHRVVALLFVILGGKARLKRYLARFAPVEPKTLPYRQEVVNLARDAKTQGRPVILVTASDQTTAGLVAAHLEVFDEAVGSDGRDNLKGPRKAAFLVERYGEGGFQYVGDATADLPVWAAAREAIMVAPHPRTLRAAQRVVSRAEVIVERPSKWRAALRELRPHQWAKNLLLFVPLYFAHEYDDWSLVFGALMAFFAFSFSASSIYVLNDLLDLPSDRRHRTKRNRPLASGALAIPEGLLLMVLSFGLGLYLAVKFVNPAFVGMLLGYVALTTLYSFVLKRLMIIDVLTLASLFTYRVMAGSVAVQVPLSFWLLAFSIFFFTSLAFVKRYSELIQLRQSNERALRGRDYVLADIPVVTAIGPAAGLLAVLVFALYINSPSILTFYSTPQALWGICLILVYWVTRIWFLAARDAMHDDPVLFAVRDKVSIVCGFLSVLCLLAARF
ncbi:MAG: UbiA family prenyltransferase [Myxococcota bacterium]